MKKTTIACALLSTCLCTTLLAEKQTFKGIVVDPYGAPFKDISINLNGEIYLYPNNRFVIQANKGDTLKFRLDGVTIKDTVLTNTTKVHLIRLKPEMVDDGEKYYDSSQARFQDKRFSLTDYIALNLRYPADALKDSISGVAHVRFRIDENGEKSDFYVKPSLSPSLDEEAIRLVRMMPGVIPALSGNHYVPIYSFIPVRFNCLDFIHGRSKEVKLVSSNRNQIDQSRIYEKSEFNPSFPGGETLKQEYIKKNLIYPSDAKQGDKKNAVNLKFVVDTTGTIQNISLRNSLTPSLDNAAIALIKKMPRWIPAMINGKKVSSWVKIPVDFSLSQKYPVKMIEMDSAEISSDNEPFIIVEQMPEFPGGIPEMMKFLSNNVRYPAEGERKGVTGMEILSFVVSKSGKIDDICIVRSVGPSFDEESIRVVSIMPRWTPGKVNGKEVPVKFTLPIRYSLK